MWVSSTSSLALSSSGSPSNEDDGGRPVPEGLVDGKLCLWSIAGGFRSKGQFVGREVTTSDGRKVIVLPPSERVLTPEQLQQLKDSGLVPSDENDPGKRYDSFVES